MVKLLFALTIGFLFASSMYLLLRRTWMKVVLGVALLGHACNVFIFAFGGIEWAKAPLINDLKTQLVTPFSDPLPQALILTAIVIGFGIQAFLVIMMKKAYGHLREADLDQLREES